MAINRQYLLNAHPKGQLLESDLRYHEDSVPECADGDVLLKAQTIALEPAMRGWMENRADYMAPMAVGDIMRAMAVAEVVESRHADYVAGERVAGLFGMQDYSLLSASSVPPQKVDAAMDNATFLGVMGVTGLTAWCGMHAIGKPQAGQTVLVSGAAGATGSVVGQLAKLAGCTVIGTAGSDEKCHWLVNDLGFDGAINYKQQSIAEAVRETCPDGLDIYWDNVGGELLDVALDNLAKGARVVLCGAISRYNASGPLPGPKNYFNLVFRNAEMKGFVVFDYVHLFEQASAELQALLVDGSLKHHEDIQQGFKQLPDALLRLFRGDNTGKQLVQVE